MGTGIKFRTFDDGDPSCAVVDIELSGVAEKFVVTIPHGDADAIDKLMVALKEGIEAIDNWYMAHCLDCHCKLEENENERCNACRGIEPDDYDGPDTEAEGRGER